MWGVKASRELMNFVTDGHIIYDYNMGVCLTVLKGWKLGDLEMFT
jgi:hypothetical protein